jgi:hypothetical protein
MHSKVYTCFELITKKKVIISKDVRFDELERGYPLLQPYPIENNSKIVV